LSRRAESATVARDAKVRDVLASCVERIVVTPSSKTGIMAVSTGAYTACGHKKNDRSEERSLVSLVAGLEGMARPRVLRPVQHELPVRSA
jgi:hypothetical protein